MKDKILVDHAIELMHKYWPESETGPNWIDVISASRGWLCQDVKDKMTVTFHGKRYEIKRIK